MLNRPIKLITFDADDTLWDFNRMMQRGTEAVARAIMLRVPEYNFITADYLNDIQHQAILKADPQTVDYIELRRVAFAEMLREAGHYEAAALADELAEIYVQARQERYEFFEDAHATLEALRGRYPLGYVTNGTTTMELVGLEPYFDFAIYPETLKMRKPRPEIFQHAAQLVGCEPSEIMHVGDDLTADIRGIQSVGGVSVWFNSRGLANTTNVTPDFEIQTLTEIISLLPAVV